MSVKYLKKKKFYDLAKELLKDVKLPIMKECEYKFFRGAEWLSFACDENYHHYNICSQCGGAWIHIEEYGYESSFSDAEYVLLNSEIFSQPVNGKYTYHSIKGKRVQTYE